MELGYLAAIVVIVLVVLVGIMRAYRVAGPSEALIITGRGGQEDQKVVSGGRVIVYPFVQRAYSMSLASRQIRVDIEGISKNGIQLQLTGVAQVKVGGDDISIRRAAQRFLNQQDQIDHYTQEILAGSLRAVVGTLTVEQIIQDRASFAASVSEEAEHSMNNQGLVIDTFQISSVDDQGDYITNMGRPQAAEVAKLAAIAEAQATREAAEAQALADEKVAVAQQTLALKQAEIKEETDARLASANAAGPLAEAAQQQRILEQEELVAVRQAELKAKQLDTEVRRPADAERYRQVQIAEAAKAAAFLAAEAELARRRADAQAVELEGAAQAAAVRAQGEAEASATLAKAEAYKQFNDAAVLDRMLATLPEVARELAAPYGQIKDLTVISNDGAGKLSQSVTTNLAETLSMLKSLTGVDLADLARNVASEHKDGSRSAASENLIEASALSANGETHR
ncbi:flotillin family protein [Arthrobacter mangrovi]|uniref:Flotillin n=1 Tax=Arthrobacter mangrovi TaxID=2966350 RepID=A0ABQ5MX72_9MICC|nr:flotillin family protein [Arthrobacter mangrovi]GLB68587.1 flotillin [Arthrobacter mangrovi]